MARWTTAREVEGGADLMSRVDSPILSPEKERRGSVASLQETESEFECEFEFWRNLNLDLKIVELGLEKIEEEKKEREVEVGVSVESEAILGSVRKKLSFLSMLCIEAFFFLFYPIYLFKIDWFWQGFCFVCFFFPYQSHFF
jgi:hypothetical protein